MSGYDIDYWKNMSLRRIFHFPDTKPSFSTNIKDTFTIFLTPLIVMQKQGVIAVTPFYKRIQSPIQ